MTSINTIPNVTDVERDNDLSNSPEGSLIYVTTFNELQIRKLGNWVPVVESTISSSEQNVYVSNNRVRTNSNYRFITNKTLYH